MNGDYPYPDRSQTHYLECWRERGHHNCAVAEIERLQARLETIEEVIEDLDKKYKRGERRER